MAAPPFVLVLDHAKLTLFFAASAILIITPGPAVLYIVGRSVSQGRGAGLVSALGVGAGNLVHVLAAVAGLSAVIASSALAFSALSYVGAAYLFFLGLRKLFSTPVRWGESNLRPDLPAAVFKQGVLVGAL